jgi:hypothetical protein
MMARTKYSTTKSRLIPHARCTDPLGSGAQEENILDKTPLETTVSSSISVAVMVKQFNRSEEIRRHVVVDHPWFPKTVCEVAIDAGLSCLLACTNRFFRTIKYKVLYKSPFGHPKVGLPHSTETTIDNYS